MSKPLKLTEEAIHDALKDLHGWEYREGKLHKKFVLGDFVEAFGFITRIALHAEKMNHHPELFNVFKRVEIALTTHDSNGVSELDLELARRIDASV